MPNLIRAGISPCDVCLCLCAGEYIAVEKLETDYSDTDVVEQIWCPTEMIQTQRLQSQNNIASVCISADPLQQHRHLSIRSGWPSSGSAVMCTTVMYRQRVDALPTPQIAAGCTVTRSTCECWWLLTIPTRRRSTCNVAFADDDVLLQGVRQLVRERAGGCGGPRQEGAHSLGQGQRPRQRLLRGAVQQLQGVSTMPAKNGTRLRHKSCMLPAISECTTAEDAKGTAH